MFAVCRRHFPSALHMRSSDAGASVHRQAEGEKQK